MKRILFTFALSGAALAAFSPPAHADYWKQFGNGEWRCVTSNDGSDCSGHRQICYRTPPSSPTQQCAGPDGRRFTQPNPRFRVQSRRHPPRTVVR